MSILDATALPLTGVLWEVAKSPDAVALVDDGAHTEATLFHQLQ